MDRYEEALKKAKQYYNDDAIASNVKAAIDTIFPELVESEDERIRREIIDYISTADDKESWIAWLEKQGNDSDKECKQNVHEPKVKVGDWIIYKDCDVDKITKFDGDKVIFESGEWIYADDMNCDCRLWSIHDVQPGDILSDDLLTVIFKKFDNPRSKKHIIAYIGLDVNGNLQVTDEDWTLSRNIHPATKEQRDVLRKKMKADGYEWNSDVKELKKIGETTGAWSEYDNEKMDSIIECILIDKQMHPEYAPVRDGDIKWIKSIKNRLTNSEENIKHTTYSELIDRLTSRTSC